MAGILFIVVVMLLGARTAYYYGAGTEVYPAPFWKLWDWSEYDNPV